MTPLEQLVSDYLGSCRARGLAPKTISGSYGYPLERVFLPWCAEQQITRPEQLSNRVLDRFSNQLLTGEGARGVRSKSTVWTYVKAVRLLITWARREGEEIRGNPSLPKLPDRQASTLSRQEIARMERAASNTRDALIVRLFADTGIRVGELCGLTTDDLIEQQRHYYVRVMGKGSRQRLVPVMPPLYRRLLRWARDSRPQDASTDRLFVARLRDGLGEYRPLTPSGVQQMVRQLAKVAGIDKRVHPHLFRHSSAHFLLQQGTNAMVVARTLGHRDLTMINRVYANLTPTDVSDALMRAYQQERAS